MLAVMVATEGEILARLGLGPRKVKQVANNTFPVIERHTGKEMIWSETLRRGGQWLKYIHHNTKTVYAVSTINA